MGTSKICAAVNKRAAHKDRPCDHLRAAVCGCFANAKVSAHRDHLDGVEAQFGGSIFVQPAKDLSSIRMQNRENKGEREKGIEEQAYQK